VQASSAGVQQQLESSKTIHCPAIFAAKTIEYQPCGKAVPELMNVAMGRRPRPPKVDQFAAAFAVAGEKQEMVADQETLDC
jgi:hypothetical protein